MQMLPTIIEASSPPIHAQAVFAVWMGTLCVWRRTLYVHYRRAHKGHKEEQADCERDLNALMDAHTRLLSCKTKEALEWSADIESISTATQMLLCLATLCNDTDSDTTECQQFSAYDAGVVALMLKCEELVVHRSTQAVHAAQVGLLLVALAMVAQEHTRRHVPGGVFRWLSVCISRLGTPSYDAEVMTDVCLVMHVACSDSCALSAGARSSVACVNALRSNLTNAPINGGWCRDLLQHNEAGAADILLEVRKKCFCETLESVARSVGL
jgi:hypothetical protein